MALRTGGEPDVAARDASLPTILAIVVTHNGRKWLAESLAALAAQSYGALDVLVVDDATSDSRKRPQIRRIAKRHLGRSRRWGYLRTPRPLGFGGAINWAMSRVRTDADLLLFLHDDAALDRQAVEHMVSKLMSDESTAIVGPKVVDWDDPQRLEEVGMLTDRFGYPYKGLEDDEIDLGQHDSINEVFYVTSTCMLIRHETFRQLKGWDARMRAFSEDLDLCWRARLAGYTVRVEPRACARHAIALARGDRSSPFHPTRYFIRRNRLRTVFKNTSTIRLLTIVPQFILLALTEMLGFIVLRQPREIVALARALVWNLAHLPQTMSERARVQKQRRVSDLKLSRLTVSQAKRVRFYISHQRDRLEETWGRRAELVAQRTSQAKLFGLQLKGWMGLAAVLTVLALVLGFREVWWSPPVTVGELLPFPERATASWRAFLGPWRGVGLGQSGPNTPGLALLQIFPIVTFGAAGAAQKLLIAVLGLVAFAGAYRSVADLVDRPGRIAAGAVYLFGAVGYSSLRAGALGALVFGAAAPWVLLSLTRIAGWVRPPGWRPGTSVARVALGAGVSAAFVPGSLFVYLIAAVLLTVARSMFRRDEGVLRALGLSAAGIAVAWAMLLPWSATWFSEGGPLAILRDDANTAFAGSFRGHDTISMLLGQTPRGPVFAGLAAALLGVVAVVAAEGQRRRFALALWLLIATMGFFSTAFATGLIGPFVASPLEMGVLSSAGFAALSGLAVGAFKLDLPRRGFGLVHWFTLAALSTAVAMFVLGLGPEILRGGWAPGRDGGRADPEVIEQVGSLFDAEAQEIGQFRALWVGQEWTPPFPSTARPAAPYMVTSSRGQVITDLFERRSGRAEDQLDRVLTSVQEGRTDRAGVLLGAFNVRLVILPNDERLAEPWLGQRDLGLVRTEDEYLMLRSEAPLERAALYSGLPTYVRAVDEVDPSLITDTREVQIGELEQGSASRYRADVSSPGTVFIAEAYDPGWTARVGDREIERIPGGWGNAFEVPEGERGELVVAFPRVPADYLWLLGIALLWIVVIGSSFSRHRSRFTPVAPDRGAGRRAAGRAAR